MGGLEDCAQWVCEADGREERAPAAAEEEVVVVEAADEWDGCCDAEAEELRSASAEDFGCLVDCDEREVSSGDVDVAGGGCAVVEEEVDGDGCWEGTWVVEGEFFEVGDASSCGADECVADDTDLGGFGSCEGCVCFAALEFDDLDGDRRV